MQEYLKSARFRNLLTFASFSYLLLWLLVTAVLVALPYLTGSGFFFENQHKMEGMTDFARFYVVGMVARSALRLHAYDIDVSPQFFAQLYHGALPLEGLGIWYVPHFFPIMLSFSFLPLAVAYCLWLGLSLSAGYFACRLLLVKLRGFNLKQLNLAFLAVLTSLPSLIVVRTGQTTWLLTSLLIGLYYCLVKKKEVLGGVLLALSTVKPQYSILFVCAMVCGRRWKLLFSFGVTVALLLGLAMLTIGVDNVIHYPAIVHKYEDPKVDQNVFPEHMVSIRALLSSYMSVSEALDASFGFMALALVAIFFLWRKVTDSTLPFVMAITVTLTVLFSPHSNQYDCLLMTIPAMLVVPDVSLFRTYALTSGATRWWSVFLWWYCALTWLIGPLPGDSNRGFMIMEVVSLILGFMALRQSNGASKLSS